MKLYLLAGKADTGKNEFADLFKEELEHLGHKVCLLRITAPLYHYAKEQFGLSIEEENKPRSFLQHLGIEVIQKKLNQKFFLLDRLSEDITVLNEFFEIGIITDGRLIDEFIELKRRYPMISIWKIERENYRSNLTKEEQEHLTETDLDREFIYDEVIINTTKEELKKEARRLAEKENSVNNIKS